MKVTITMKTPDVVFYAAQEEKERVLETEQDLTLAEMNEVAEQAFAEVQEASKKFFQYGEAVTLELDTEKQTCTVREVKK